MKKRLVSLVMTLCFIFAMLPINAFGAASLFSEGIRIEVQNAVLQSGTKNVTLTVSVPQNSGFAGINYKLEYDTSALKLVSQPTSVQNSGLEFTFGSIGAPHYGMITAKNGQNVKYTGNILTYTFEVLDTAKPGKYDVKFITEGIGANGVELGVLDENRNPVSVTSNVGSVTVPGYKVSFNTVGGSGTFEDLLLRNGQSASLPASKPQRYGYDFVGWSKSMTSTTAEYAPASAISVTADTVLYAVWAKKTVEGDVELTVQNASANAGETVTVNIDVTKNSGFSSLGFYIDYDKTKLEFVSSSAPDSFFHVSPAEETGLFGVIPTNISENNTSLGTVVSLTFKVRANAAGEAKVSVRIAPEQCSRLEGTSLKSVNIVTVDGKVTVGGGQLLGDINLDGSVDIYDAILLFNHSMMEEFYPIGYTGNIDFTKDGSLDIFDAILLFNYSMMPEFYPIA